MSVLVNLMESKDNVPDHEGASGDNAIDDVGGIVAGANDNSARIAAAVEAGDDGPAQATSVGLWGPSGMGKTQFAATLLLDGGYAPGLYIDVDGGRPALRAYENADLLVHRPATRIEDVERLVREVQSGRIVNRAGKRVRSVIIDATSCILDNEIGARGSMQRSRRTKRKLWAHRSRCCLASFALCTKTTASRAYRSATRR